LVNFLATQTAVEGESAKIECKIFSVPQAEICWFRRVRNSLTREIEEKELHAGK